MLYLFGMLQFAELPPSTAKIHQTTTQPLRHQPLHQRRHETIPMRRDGIDILTPGSQQKQKIHRYSRLNKHRYRMTKYIPPPNL